MSHPSFAELAAAIAAGDLVPFLGPSVLADVVNKEDGMPIPADSDSLIIAMNNGRPMAPKLMYEFPRAAMNIELKRGRSAVNRFLTSLYAKKQWSRAALHEWLAAARPGFVIDINRDLQLQESYNDTPHLLITGIARIGGTEFRYKIFHYDGENYSEITNEEVDSSLPILFKPLGTPVPEEHYIASDADFVDYLTELMGGFSIPAFLKEQRKGKQYLFLGLRMTRDTERMLLSDITYASLAEKGWALIAEPTDKERCFCKRQGITIIEATLEEFLAEVSPLAEAG